MFTEELVRSIASEPDLVKVQNFEDEEELEAFLSDENTFIVDPYELPDMEKAVAEAQAIAEKLGMELKIHDVEFGSIIAGVQSSQSSGLLLCMVVVPFVLMFLSYLLYRKHYILDEEEYDRICRVIAERKQVV